jgi:hydroxymethylbilane synthase
MIPAPAQGAMVVVAMQNDAFTLMLYHINDIETEIVTYIERHFLKLEGGCTAIGALAIYDDEEEDTIHFQGFVFIRRKRKDEVDKTVPIEEWKKLGFILLRILIMNKIDDGNQK